MVTVERGPQKSALAPGAITIMHMEAEQKMRNDFAEIIHVDEIEHLLDTEEQLELKITSGHGPPQKL